MEDVQPVRKLNKLACMSLSKKQTHARTHAHTWMHNTYKHARTHAQHLQARKHARTHMHDITYKHKHIHLSTPTPTPTRTCQQHLEVAHAAGGQSVRAWEALGRHSQVDWWQPEPELTHDVTYTWKHTCVKGLCIHKSQGRVYNRHLNYIITNDHV